jgi:hypothetical protein
MRGDSQRLFAQPAGTIGHNLCAVSIQYETCALQVSIIINSQARLTWKVGPT